MSDYCSFFDRYELDINDSNYFPKHLRNILVTLCKEADKAGMNIVNEDENGQMHIQNMKIGNYFSSAYSEGFLPICSKDFLEMKYNYLHEKSESLNELNKPAEENNQPDINKMKDAVRKVILPFSLGIITTLGGIIYAVISIL